MTRINIDKSTIDAIYSITDIMEYIFEDGTEPDDERVRKDISVVQKWLREAENS